MKVAIVTFKYPPDRLGGIGALNYELARGLSKYVEVVVITGGDKDEVYRNGGVKVYSLKAPKLRPKAFYFHLYNAERVAKIIEREKPDVIQLNDNYNLFLKLLRNTKSKIIKVFHGSPSPFNRFYYDLRTLSPNSLYDIAWNITLIAYNYLIKLVSLSLEYIDAAVHVSKHTMYYNLNYGDKMLRKKTNVVIYPGLNTEALHKIRLNTPKNSKKRKSLVFGARLVPYKGVLHLLKAFELAYMDDNDLELHIFGDGPLKLQVLKTIKRLRHKGIKGIYYHGKVSRQEFLRNITTSRVLIHPSLYEASPMVVIEATMLETPVLAHKAPYSEEFVECLGVGRTVNIESINEFANAIISIANDENLMRHVMQSYERLQKLFDINETVKRYLALYQKLVGD